MDTEIWTETIKEICFKKSLSFKEKHKFILGTHMMFCKISQTQINYVLSTISCQSNFFMFYPLSTNDSCPRRFKNFLKRKLQQVNKINILFGLIYRKTYTKAEHPKERYAPQPGRKTRAYASLSRTAHNKGKPPTILGEKGRRDERQEEPTVVGQILRKRDVRKCLPGRLPTVGLFHS